MTLLYDPSMLPYDPLLCLNPNEDTSTQKFYMTVHSNVIHNSKNVETPRKPSTGSLQCGLSSQWIVI